MLLSFRSKLEVMVPDKVRASLPQRLLDSIKQNPQALLDPAATDSLKGHLAEAGAEDEDVQMVDRLLDLLNAALAGGLGDVFTVLVVAAGLFFGLALSFRMPSDAEMARQAWCRLDVPC